MATDATGTPTSPDNIPTFLTSADAPSGKGFNAAMTAIQTALSARVNKPSGIASGEVPVWNGSSWVRSSTTNISANSFSGYTSFTPVFCAGGIAGSLGNGSLTTDYIQFGKLVHWRGQFSVGTTTTFGGSGTLLLAMPVPYAVWLPTPGFQALSSGGSAMYTGQVWSGTGGAVTNGIQFVYAATYGGAAVGITSSLPFAWSGGGTLIWSVVYEAA